MSEIDTGAEALRALAGEMQKLYEYLREPDWAEDFPYSALTKWLNSRPSHIPLRAKAIIEAVADLNVEVERLKEALEARSACAASCIDAAEARAIEAEDAAHSANGVADLAMKHRDEAERQRDAMREAIGEALRLIASYGECNLSPDAKDDAALLATCLHDIERVLNASSAPIPLEVEELRERLIADLFTKLRERDEALGPYDEDDTERRSSAEWIADAVLALLDPFQVTKKGPVVLPELPLPTVYHADHSYPAFSSGQMKSYALQAIMSLDPRAEGGR